MGSFGIKILISTILSFLASTIKNPKSVAKYKSIIITVRDGFNALILALGGEDGPSTFAVRRGKQNVEGLLEEINSQHGKLVKQLTEE